MGRHPGVWGRPKKNIDQDAFEKLCALQCTELEICGFFGVSDRWLLDWCKRTYHGRTFFDIHREKAAGGLCSLRRNQFKLSEKNASMAIWLGKQYLGQRDVSVDSNPDQTIEDINAVLDEACSESESEG